MFSTVSFNEMNSIQLFIYLKRKKNKKKGIVLYSIWNNFKQKGRHIEYKFFKQKGRQNMCKPCNHTKTQVFTFKLKISDLM